jgi:hypothetical protein
VDIKPFPSRRVSQVALSAIALASMFILVSILWQHVSSSAAASIGQSLAYGTVKGHVGSAAMVLGWVSVLLTLFTMMGLLIMSRIAAAK